jgi:hypothetical protein
VTCVPPACVPFRRTSFIHPGSATPFRRWPHPLSSLPSTLHLVHPVTPSGASPRPSNPRACEVVSLEIVSACGSFPSYPPQQCGRERPDEEGGGVQRSPMQQRPPMPQKHWGGTRSSAAASHTAAEPMRRWERERGGPPDRGSPSPTPPTVTRTLPHRHTTGPDPRQTSTARGRSYGFTSCACRSSRAARRRPPWEAGSVRRW